MPSVISIATAVLQGSSLVQAAVHLLIFFVMQAAEELDRKLPRGRGWDLPPSVGAAEVRPLGGSTGVLRQRGPALESRHSGQPCR